MTNLGKSLLFLNFIYNLQDQIVKLFAFKMLKLENQTRRNSSNLFDILAVKFSMYKIESWIYSEKL